MTVRGYSRPVFSGISTKSMHGQQMGRLQAQNILDSLVTDHFIWIQETFGHFMYIFVTFDIIGLSVYYLKLH